MPLNIDLNVSVSNSREGGTHEFQLDLNHPPCLDEFQLFDLNYPPSLGGDDNSQSLPCFNENELHNESNQSSCLSVQEDNHIYLNEHEDEGESNSLKKCKFLTNDQRKAIGRMLMKSSHKESAYPGMIRRICLLYNVHSSVIYRIWNQVKKTGDDTHNKITCGRKKVQFEPQKLLEVPLSKRTTLRSLSSALDIGKTSLIRLQKAGVICRHSSAFNPLLKYGNKIARLKYCLSMLDEGSLPRNPRLKSMHNIVFIDDKWFYMTKKFTNYYLLVEEDEPHRTCKNKNFICKVMFLGVVTRPRFDNEGVVRSSRKIGIYPFVKEEPTKRTSVNRVAVTLVKKPITSVTREVNKMFLINHVLPTIKSQWPREDARETKFIQQDNAPSHIDKDDEDFRQATSEGGFDIQLTCQPPNSPDLNVLDLGFFNAIQSIQHKESTKSVDDLIKVVENAFYAFSLVELDKIFMTLQSCMIEIMKAKGSNKYKIPRDAMYKQGGLPSHLSCDPSLIQDVTEYVQNVNAL